MKEIENLIKVEIALARETMIFQLLGEFGDRLSRDVQKEMREQAEKENKTAKMLKKRVEKSCTTF